MRNKNNSINPNSNYIQQFFVVLLMMLLAFFIQELPTSNVLQMVLPEWPFIFTLYFAVSTRYFFGVTSAFVVGLIEDVFLGVPTLGLHAGIYVLGAFILIISRLNFIHMSLASQSLTIGLLVLIKILIVATYSAIIYNFPSHFWVFLSVPLSILLWPGIHLFFRFFADKNRE